MRGGVADQLGTTTRESGLSVDGTQHPQWCPNHERTRARPRFLRLAIAGTRDDPHCAFLCCGARKQTHSETRAKRGSLARRWDNQFRASDLSEWMVGAQSHGVGASSLGVQLLSHGFKKVHVQTGPNVARRLVPHSSTSPAGAAWQIQKFPPAMIPCLA